MSSTPYAWRPWVVGIASVLGTAIIISALYWTHHFPNLPTFIVALLTSIILVTAISVILERSLTDPKITVHNPSRDPFQTPIQRRSRHRIDSPMPDDLGSGLTAHDHDL